MTARPSKPTLPHIGTKVAVTLGGHTAYGVVEDYEHYNPHQVTFPVKFGRKTVIILASDITVLPDDQQPDDRQLPRHTGYYEHHDCSSCER
jgi:hypothetical protein